MNETIKIGFFKRIKMAIFDLENYKIFYNEKLSTAIKYLLKLMLILVAILSVSTTYQMVEEEKYMFDYVKKEFPDFTYEKGNLTINEYVQGYDANYDSSIIADTTDVSKEKLEEYQEKALESNRSVILLKDKAIITSYGMSAEVKYADVAKTFDIDKINKNEFVAKFTSNTFISQSAVAMFGYTFIILLVEYILGGLENALIVALFGWIAAKILKTGVKFSQAFIISIYGLTLSNVLNVVYLVISSFTGFQIAYLDLLYLIIAYIYMLTVLTIRKNDIVKGISDDDVTANIKDLQKNKKSKEIKVEAKVEVQPKKEEKKNKSLSKEKKEDINKKEKGKEKEDGKKEQ